MMHPAIAVYTAAKACSKSCTELAEGIFEELRLSSRRPVAAAPGGRSPDGSSTAFACRAACNFAVCTPGSIVGNWYRTHCCVPVGADVVAARSRLGKLHRKRKRKVFREPEQLFLFIVLAYSVSLLCRLCRGVFKNFLRES